MCPLWKDPDSGYSAHAEACTSDAMLPTGFELDSGKRFSCECRYFALATSVLVKMTFSDRLIGASLRTALYIACVS